MPDTVESGTHITNGELARAVGLIRTDIKDLKSDIDKKPTTSDIKYLEQRIIDLEEWQKWAMRVGAPAIIMVIINTFNTIDGKLG